MADLKQALLWLAEGKKIRHLNWGPGCFVILGNHQIIDEDGHESSESLFSGNWELYEEPKDINVRGSRICSTHNCDIRGVEITAPLEDDADYIVWDKNGNRSFAYWDSEDKCFYSLQCDCRCALDIKSWKKLPEQDEKT